MTKQPLNRWKWMHFVKFLHCLLFGHCHQMWFQGHCLAVLGSPDPTHSNVGKHPHRRLWKVGVTALSSLVCA
jgi:hypothetical protein